MVDYYEYYFSEREAGTAFGVTKGRPVRRDRCAAMGIVRAGGRNFFEWIVEW